MGYAKPPLGPYVHMNLIGPQQVSKCNRNLFLYLEINFHIYRKAICCYDKFMNSVTLSINIGVTSVQKYINSMRRRWNSTVIKRMCKRLTPGPFSSSSSLGLGIRLGCCTLFPGPAQLSVALHIGTHMHSLQNQFIKEINLYRCERQN